MPKTTAKKKAAAPAKKKAAGPAKKKAGGPKKKAGAPVKKKKAGAPAKEKAGAPAKKKAASAPAKKKAASAPSAAATDAARALDEIAFFVRTGEDPGEQLPALLERLHAHADPSLLPGMFGLLDDEDTSGLLWPVFYVAEEQGDAYLQALVAALPHLQERAPGWAEIAVLRILNTRGEPEDCTASFDRVAAKAPAAAKTALQRLLGRMLADSDEPLTAEQRASVKATAKALGVKTH